MMIMHGQAAAMGMNASYASCARATRPPSEPPWKKSIPRGKFAAMLRILLVLALVVLTEACHRKEFGGERCEAPRVPPCAGCKIRCMREEIPACNPGVVENGACVKRATCDCT